MGNQTTTNTQGQLLNAAVHLGATGIYQFGTIVESQERDRQAYHGQNGSR